MTYKVIHAIAAVGALVLFGAQPASADSMKCSDQEKACVVACQRMPRALVGDCIANCRARANFCRQTGCWNEGTKRYCGLSRR